MKKWNAIIHNAITAHFACDKVNLKCDIRLEDYVGIASDYFNYLAKGKTTPELNRALQTHRYKVKTQLVGRYLASHE